MHLMQPEVRTDKRFYVDFFCVKLPATVAKMHRQIVLAPNGQAALEAARQNFISQQFTGLGLNDAKSFALHAKVSDGARY